ncbi:MAG: hypothetical protein P1U88_14685 [Thalassobaculaceae bacterium]|nr:hypothetical protein [Thalassobaculaceae bacterium]
MTRSLIILIALATLGLSTGAYAGSRGHDARGDDRHTVDWRRDHRSRDCWESRQWTHSGYRKVVRCDRPHDARKTPRRPKQVYTYIQPGYVQPVPVPVLPPGATYGADFQDRYGRYCREYQSTAVIGGQRQQIYGTACRNPDGSWAPIN